MVSFSVLHNSVPAGIPKFDDHATQNICQLYCKIFEGKFPNIFALRFSAKSTLDSFKCSHQKQHNKLVEFNYWAPYFFVGHINKLNIIFIFQIHLHRTNGSKYHAKCIKNYARFFFTVHSYPILKKVRQYVING